MLTCEQIEARAHEISAIIDRSNWDRIAEAIHPQVRRVLAPAGLDMDDAQHDAWYESPEWQEQRRAGHWRTRDWTDMVVSSVTRRQCDVAFARYLKGLEGKNDAP